MGDVYQRLPIVHSQYSGRLQMEKLKMNVDYTTWLRYVRAALASINMPMDEWQTTWRFDFEREFKVGTDAATAADLANRYWWREQNKSIGQHCLTTPNCWLPRNHQGDCQPVRP